MVDDHEDYETGAAPAAHKASHELDGDDEISVAGLSGVTEALLAHSLISTAHQDAPGLIETHRLVAAAHHARYTDLEAEAVADAQIATHALVATAHQDAPGLIETHRLVAGAHHGRYTDAEARASMSPISISHRSFISYRDDQSWVYGGYDIKNRNTLNAQYFGCGVQIPHGVTVTKVILYGYRDDAEATLYLILRRHTRAGAHVDMAAITAAWVDGYNEGFDNSINSPVIDIDNYSYHMELTLNCNDNFNDVRFSGAKIEFTG